jgi:hypothetical protein
MDAQEVWLTVDVSRLVPVDPRLVWPSEASDFTPWLRDNADVLADALGIDIELTAIEHQVGPFFLDVIGRDLTNDSVLVVENQLTPTDHDHLGKLVTYAANTDAATIVWMALSFREEHRQAIAFLNDLGGEKARFFGVEIAVARIDTSAPAPLFKVIAQPNDFHAQASEAAKVTASELSGRGALYAAFWERFLEQLKAKHPGWSRARKGPAENWLSLPSPSKGGWSSYTVSLPRGPDGQQLRCELYIDSLNPAEVERRFGELYEHRDAIEATFGSALAWEALEGRRASRIAAYGAGDITEVDKHDEYLDWFLSNFERLRAALDPYLVRR